MIISASRRTDIPAFFSDWFINRIREQYAYVRNPMNPHQVSKIILSPDVVDCIVFWSKNPCPMLPRLDALNEYMYYFQFTLNGYEKELEANLPSLEERIKTFRSLSKLTGSHRVIWRYDPIIVSNKYTVQWHQTTYQYIAEKLAGYTDKCTISFIDLYSKISRDMKSRSISEVPKASKEFLAEALSDIARSNHMSMEACAEDIDLSKYQIGRTHCIDEKLISRLLNCTLDAEKDKNQRPLCGCVSSMDLGLYNTCRNGCAYCYANHSPVARTANLKQYDPLSPLLCGRLSEQDKLTVRKAESLRNRQLRLF